MFDLERLEAEFRKLPQDALSRMRATSWKRVKALGLPSKQQEAFRYVPLFTFFSEHLEPVQHCTHQSDADITLLNGQPISTLPKQHTILFLSEAARPFSALLQSRSAEEESDFFTALNGALFSEGLFIYLPPKTTLSLQINLLFSGGGIHFPKILLFLGNGSELKLVTKSQSLSSTAYCSAASIDLSLEEGAHCTLTDLTSPSSSAWHFDSLRARLKKRSTFNHFSFTKGSRTVRKCVHVTLEGEEASAMLKGGWDLKGHHQAHLNLLVDHQAPHTHSLQLFKGVVRDTAQSSFQGKILVRKEAQKAEAYQLNNNLILSERAIANSKPGLEIFADDVKASHGATIAQLQSDQLFYLQSRGLSAGDAKELLQKAFLQEILDHVPA